MVLGVGLSAWGQIKFSGSTQQTTAFTGTAAGSSWSSVSRRDAKENFQDVNAREVLEKVAALPILT